MDPLLLSCAAYVIKSLSYSFLTPSSGTFILSAKICLNFEISLKTFLEKSFARLVRFARALAGARYHKSSLNCRANDVC